MKAFCLVGALALAPSLGCANDDASPGARAYCAQGGELTDCPDAERDVAAACWRLVDCGAIAIDGQEDFSLDWGFCMDDVETMTADKRRLVVNCIAASTCDQLRVDGSPNNPNRDQMYCYRLGRDTN